MPTYDYRCKACGHELELFQSMTERPKRKCPSCGKNQLERLIGTGGGLIFKGGGFYQTDYRSKGYQDAAKRDSEGAKDAAKPAPEGGDGAKADGKPKSAPEGGKGGSGKGGTGKGSAGRSGGRKDA